ncbi:MAG TPA: TonB-dependent receptor [Longimicrobiales bacterium]|nr:TonB-dependent receptor [Longimicrobiales bacterium]
MGDVFKRFRGSFLLALMALVCASAANAQTSGSITGRITNKETQTPVAGATVQATTATGRVVASAVTDADGQYRLANVPAGTYSVVVSMVGFQTNRSTSVRVVAGEPSMTGVSLETEAFLLNPVVVSASRHAEKAITAPAAVSVVPEREIAERVTTTPVEHLRNVPGVDIMTTGVQSTNVVARGFNNIFSGALHTLTDYRAANVPSLRVNFLHFLPQNNDDYARIEVVLGPGAALYGPNTANGVLHFLTKSPLDDQGTTVSIAGGTFPGAAPNSIVTPSLTAGSLATKSWSLFQATARTAQKLSETFGIKVSGQYLSAPEYFYRDLAEDSAAARIATIQGNEAALRATGLFPTGATDIVSRAARIANRDYDIKRWGIDGRADWRPTGDFQAVLSGGMTNDNSIELTGIGAGQAVDWKYSYLQGRANFKRWFAQAYMNMSDAGDTYLLRNGAPISDQSKLWAVQLQHQASLGTRQSFTYGADYISTNPVTNGTINGTREASDNYNEFGAYIQSETHLTSMFDVVLAGRYDKHSRLDEAVLSPRAALVFHPNENHSFRATYNQAFSTPTSLNLFLDIDAGPLGALGPFGFRAHAQAPGREGINLHDANGNIQIRSPFSSSATATSPGAGGSNYLNNPGTLNDVSLQSVYLRQVSAIGLANAGVGGNAALMGALRSFAQDPVFAASNSLVLTDPLTRKVIPFASGVADVAGIEESTTQTYELGYKGLIADKIMFAADVWHAKHKNFTSPLITATPLVQLNPQALAAYLIPRLTPAVGAAQAGAIAAGIAQLPGGIVSSAGTTEAGPNLVLTYINFGTLDVDGADVSLAALLSDKWQWTVSGSLVSDDFFNLPLGNKSNDSTVVALNAPKKKASTALTYRSVGSGLNAEARLRYQDAFPANSAGYVGLACVPSAPAGSGPCVQSFTLLDLNVGYRLPVAGASIQLSVTNLFDEKYKSFIGTPEIRRMAMIRLRYDM